MHMTVTGRNLDLTPALKEYLADKLLRAQKHFDYPLEVVALLSVAKNPSIANSQTAEITIQVNGTTIRGQESSENMYAAIDLVADKVARQLRKYKTKYWTHLDEKRLKLANEEAGSAVTEDDSDTAVMKALTLDEIKPKIVRSKKFPLKPMMPEEAAAHMDLLGHDFFMFINFESGHVNTVYHRRDGNYGLIEPDA